MDLNKPLDAINAYQKSRDIYVNAMGADSTAVANAEINMAVVNLYYLGEYQTALELFELALGKFVANNGKKNNYYYMSLPYATCLIKLNQFERAKAVVTESIEYYRNRSVKSVRNQSLGESLLANILIQEGDDEPARAILIRVKDSVFEHYGDTIHGEMLNEDLKKLNIN